MKISLFLILVSAISLQASSGFSQNKKMTVDMQNVTVREVINEIEKQGGISFLIDENLAELNRRVSVSFVDQPIKDVLQNALSKADMTYEEIKDDYYLNQQQITLTGRVTEAESGEPLPGVNIIIQGTTIGTVTNVDGNYSIEVAPDATLVFSFVGYLVQEVPVDGRTTINVQLEESPAELEEVVVVGYGQQRRESVTASIAQVTGAEIASVPTTNLGNALTGRLPGLVTIQISDQPGASDPRIYLRGVGTLNSSEPLIIIDGVPSDMRSLMQLDAQTIENISILKDASATAVYGVRGANGVIIAQTKRGQAGVNRVRVEQSTSVNIPQSTFIHANGADWVTGYNEAMVTDGFPQNQLPQSILNAFRDNSNPLIYPGTPDPFSTLVKDFSLNTQTNVSINGGTENASFYVAMGYFHNDGITRTDFPGPVETAGFRYNRYNLRANLDLSVTPSTKARFTSFARIGVQRDPYAHEGGIFPQQWGRLFMEINPFIGSGFSELHPGKFINPSPYSPVRAENPLLWWIYGRGFRDQTENELNMSVGIDQSLDVITKGLSTSLNVSYRGGFTERVLYSPGGYHRYVPIYRADDPYDPVPGDSTIVLQKTGTVNPGGYSGGNYSANRNMYLDFRVNYDRSFNNHNLGALLLYNQNKNYYPSGVQYNNIPMGWVGLVGRLTYDYDTRYLFEFNVGYNGSENFHQDRRFGLFPAISAGWNIANEPFMQGVDFINQLRLRGSIGQVGNDRHGQSRFVYIDDAYRRGYLSRGGRNNWNEIGYNFGVDIPEHLDGAIPMSLGNPNVTWETATKYNAGIDLGLFDNRFTIAADYFYEWREDILISRANIPAFLRQVVNIAPVNYGIVENSGFETEVRWRHRVGDFAYHVSGSVSYARNKLIQTDEVPPLEPYMSAIGHPLGSNLGFIALGLFTEEEAQLTNAGEDPENYPMPLFVTGQVEPGFIRYKDLNGDGVIDDRDQTRIGYPFIPQVNFAGQFGLSYKGWSLNTTWQGVTQVTRPIGGYLKESYNPSHMAVLQGNFDERWTQEKVDQGIEIGYPRLTHRNSGYNNRTSTYWMADATYIRLKSVSVGYDFENLFWGIRQLGVYLHGYNLLTFSRFPDYKYNDPEKVSSSSRPTEGFYPMMKVYNLSVNLTF